MNDELDHGSHSGDSGPGDDHVLPLRTCGTHTPLSHANGRTDLLLSPQRAMQAR